MIEGERYRREIDKDGNLLLVISKEVAEKQDREVAEKQDRAEAHMSLPVWLFCVTCVALAISAAVVGIAMEPCGVRDARIQAKKDAAVERQALQDELLRLRVEVARKQQAAP